jgi:hypothetical protein
MREKGFSAIEGIVALVILFGAYYYFFYESTGKTYEPGILVDSVPEQVNTKGSKVLDHKGYTLITKAAVKVRARVLGKERYYFDDGADVVPVDLALGWKEMSDQSVIDKLKIWQSNRFYYWRTREDYLPVSRDKIEHNSSNWHIIPSSDEIEDKILSVSKGDIVSFEGFLVDVTKKGGFMKNTSMVRTDTGPGACEIVFVISFKVE